MIYPNVTLESWLEKHPSLEVIKVECLECKHEIPTLKPFITKDYLGLSASHCPNCKVEHRAYTGIAYSESEKSAWFSEVMDR